MNSCLYEGFVYHSRLSPKKHSFKYKVSMLFIDSKEIGLIFKNYLFWSDSGRKNIAYFDRDKYLQPKHKSIDHAVAEYIYDKFKYSFTGSVKILTNITVLGLCFNPVTFYYCYNNIDDLEFVVTEITNTPWGEKHSYVFDVRNNDNCFFPKEFHISPFFSMDMSYDWSFGNPGEKISINMDCFESKKVFNANLKLCKKKITSKNLIRFFIWNAFINYKVLLYIYWQAFKLFLKRIPFYDHPKTKRNK